MPEAPFLSDLVNFKIFRDIKDYFRELIIFVSNDDEYILESVKYVKEKLGGELIELKNHGHFTFGDFGTDKFPELLEKVLE